MTTVAGTGKIGYRNGAFSSTRLALPEYVLAASKTVLYFTEVGTNRVRELNLRTKQSRLITGNGKRGSSNGTQSATSFNGVKGLLKVSSGTLLIADQSNDLIRATGLR